VRRATPLLCTFFEHPHGYASAAERSLFVVVVVVVIIVPPYAVMTSEKIIDRHI